MWLVGHTVLWPFKKNYKKKSRGGGAAPAGSPTPPGPFGGKRRVLRAAEVQLLGPQVPDPGGRGLTGRRWRAARREQAGGPAEGVTRERGLCPRDEPPSTTWPRKPRPERGGAGLRPARLARPRLPRHRRGRPATACHAGPRGPPHALQTVTRAPQPWRGWRGSRKAGRTGEPAPGARCSAGP